jgi:quinohemoprotein ethanol dehydrogenase
MRRWGPGGAGMAVLVLAAAAHAADTPAPAWITADRIIHADAEPQNWPSSGRDYSEQRYGPLQSIDDANVGQLGLAWYYDLDTHRGQEATPLVIDGVMYTTSAWSKVQAFSAATGKLLWQFDPKVPGSFAIHACCDLVNRGVAAWRGRLYVGTLDGRLIALDARTGQPLWSALTVDQKRPYTITGAPLAIDGRIVIGNAGAEYGVRGYVSAYEAESGKLVWRFYTVPGDPKDGFESQALARAAQTWSGEWWQDGGGATVWNALAYDPDLGLLYFGTGNGAPWVRKLADGALADSLYAASIVAVHAATGAYAWHYQTTPGDIWDYDSTQTLTLATLAIDRRPRRVVMQASKNGFFYVLDRATGELLRANNYVPVNWASGIDLKSGRPRVRAEARYDQSGALWLGMPGPSGGHNWEPMSFSPSTGLVYIPAQELPFPYLRDPNFEPHALAVNMGIDQAKTSLPQDPKSKAQALAGLKGYLTAWDPVAGREVWRAPYAGPWNGGVLATAGNLVFQGSAAGELIAYRASDGRKLWSFAAQTGVIAAPMTFAVEGKQYVSVLAGWGGVFPLVAGELSFKSGRQVNRSRVLTFALGGHAQLPPPVHSEPSYLPPPTIAVNATLASEGAVQYARRCGSCHGDAAVSGGLVPDLRFTPALANDALWKAIIEDGALAGSGMIAFKSELTRRQEDALRAYLIKRAQDSYATRAQQR